MLDTPRAYGVKQCDRSLNIGTYTQHTSIARSCHTPVGYAYACPDIKRCGGRE